METRRLGRTGHMSTVAIFGAFAISQATQSEADKVMDTVKAAGVNHIDVAPSYGIAEERLGPWLAGEREGFFLGCKTTERTKTGAADEMRRSLDRLQVDRFDLYQIHAVTTFEELDEVTKSGGALEAIIDGRQEGLTDYIGITGHGVKSPAIFLEALRRFDFDTVLFPINFVMYANPDYRKDAEDLLMTCRQKDVGTMIIKSIARGPWGEQPQRYNTWYWPFTEMGMIQKAINFVLSQDVTGLCTVGDPDILPDVLTACENFTPLNEAELEDLIGSAGAYKPLFV